MGLSNIPGTGLSNIERKTGTAPVLYQTPAGPARAVRKVEPERPPSPGGASRGGSPT
jgi:hypothetical protein